MFQPPSIAPPPPPPNRFQSARPSGKHIATQFCTLPPRLSRDSSYAYSLEASTYRPSSRALTIDVPDYDLSDEGTSRYSCTQSVDCEACVLEGQGEPLNYCHACQEEASQETECRECNEYELSRGAAIELDGQKEKNVSCFTACKPKTRKVGHGGKNAKKELKKKEPEHDKENLEETPQ